MDTNADNLAKSIAYYFELPKNKKIKLSKSAKSLAENSNPDKVLPQFKKDFDNFVEGLIKI